MIDFQENVLNRLAMLQLQVDDLKQTHERMLDRSGRNVALPDRLNGL